MRCKCLLSQRGVDERSGYFDFKSSRCRFVVDLEPVAIFPMSVHMCMFRRIVSLYLHFNHHNAYSMS